MTDQALDRLARRVLLDAARQEYGSLIEERPEHDFSPAFEKKMKKLLRWSKHPAWHQFVQAAACLLLVLLLTGCAVLAVSPTAREAVAAWVREIYENQYIYRLHPEYDRNLSPEENVLPEVIYRPSWVPEGYQVIHELVSSQVSTTIYRDDSDGFAVLTRMHGGVFQVTRDGTETYSQVFLNGKAADLYLDENEGEANVLVWEDGEMACILSAPLSEPDIIKLAESVEAQELPAVFRPTWLPDGYCGSAIEYIRDGTSRVDYVNASGHELRLNYASSLEGMDLSADRKVNAQPVLVNGFPAELYLGVDEEGTNELVWTDEERELIFWIHGPVTEEELIKMAESMDG